MNAKFYILTLIAATIMAVGCNVNEDYDLSKVSFDDIEIGSEDSTFTVPLATITLTSDDLNGTGTGVASTGGSTLFTRASSSLTFNDVLTLINALLPSNTTIDISILVGNDELAKEMEIERLVYLLVDEMKTNEQKVLDLATIVMDYSADLDLNSFTDSTLSLKDNYNLDDVVAAINNFVLYSGVDYDEYVQTFVDAIIDLINDEIVDQLNEYSSMDVDQEVDAVEIPSDIITVLGGEDEEISIIATYTHTFPFTFEISEIVLTGTDGTQVVVKMTTEGEDIVLNTYKLSEISSILSNGANLSSGISINTYTSVAVGDYAITIKISIQKTGTIKF